MAVFRRTVFDSETMQIGLFEARPLSDGCGEVERQSLNAIALPVSGVFAKHDAPGRHVVGTPSYAVFFAADTAYRIAFPGRIGDRSITVKFADEVAPDHVARGNADVPASQGLLSPRAMMLRNVLWRRLTRAEPDQFEIEALGLDLLEISLNAVRSGNPAAKPATQARRSRALQRVKEAVASAPSRKWTVAGLAEVANLSPFHLCHVFRDTAGTSICDYVLHERLAQTLDAVLDGGDLTAIALDAGFASHSHFTARFRGFFGCSPTALRRMATASRVAELRKIVTARRH